MTVCAFQGSLFFLTFLWSAAIVPARFVQITTPLSISAEKNHPPYIAFAELERQRSQDDWDQAEARPASQLTAEFHPEREAVPQSSIRLATMVINRPLAPQPLAAKTASNDWLDGLTPSQSARLNQAQLRSDILNTEWGGETFSERAQKVIQHEQTPSNHETHMGVVLSQQVNQSQTQVVANANGVVVGSGLNSSGQVIQPVRSVASVQQGPNEEFLTKENNGSVEIFGHFQIAEGLAFGPDRYLEIRRRHEGVDAEQGQVNAADGTYRIRLSSQTGEIIARLRDQQGFILGEDRIHISQIRRNRGQILAPEFILRPRSDLAGRLTSLYGMKLKDVKANVFSGTAALSVGQDGEFEFSPLLKGSMTVLRAQARSHWPTIDLVSSGMRSDLRIFPLGWIDSLKNIISEQRRMSLESQFSSVVWGRVHQDGKTRAGVRVEIESLPGLEAIYFNEFLIPDAGLQSTSSNGLFVFVGASEGFHSLVAEVEDRYYSHQNIVVENGHVSTADLAATLRTEPSMVRAFDAFTGESQSASVIHQAIDGSLDLESQEETVATIPSLHRLSLAQVKPDAPYVSATYLSWDDDGFVHLPLVRTDWIRTLQVWAKIPDRPDTSTVVGFGMEESYLLDVIDRENSVSVLFFDRQGRPSQTGVAGGGFIIFGLSSGVREVIVTGEQSKSVSSRIFPSDPQAVTVLQFRTD